MYPTVTFSALLVTVISIGSLISAERLNEIKQTEKNCLRIFGENGYWVRAEGRCYLKVNTPTEFISDIQESYDGSFGGHSFCPNNIHIGYSYSSNSGSVCRCYAPYYPSPDKKNCVVGTKMRGESCLGQDDDDCDSLIGLVCLKDKTCGCKDAIWNETLSRCFSDALCERWSWWGSKYDEKAGACIGKADAQCNLERGAGCPANSICKKSSETTTYGSGQVFNGRCTCPEGKYRYC